MTISRPDAAKNLFHVCRKFTDEARMKMYREQAEIEGARSANASFEKARADDQDFGMSYQHEPYGADHLKRMSESILRATQTFLLWEATTNLVVEEFFEKYVKEDTK